MALSPKEFEKLRQTLAAKSRQGDIESAFKGGLSYANEGLQQAKSATNPIVAAEGLLKTGAGAIGAAFSPLAPATKYIGKGIEAAADKISDSPSVQKFSTTKTGGVTLRIAEDLQNASAILGVRTGGKALPGVFKGTVKGVQNKISPIGSNIKSFGRDIIPTSSGVINHQVSKALDFAPSDLSNISKATGNEVGPWLAENNLIGVNRASTQTLVKDFLDKNYKSVRAEIDKVKAVYKPGQLPRYTDALLAIQKKVDGVPGLEKISAEVDNLLFKKDGIKLNDVQRVKELMDDHFDLYNVVGDVSESVAKQGLANIRSRLKKLIENEVKKNTGSDISKMNNNVSTAASINNAITLRAPKGLTKSNLKIGDLGIFGIGMSFGGPLTGLALLFGKKLIESPTVRLRMAKYLDKVSDARKAKIKAELEAGNVPEELYKLINPTQQTP